MLGDWEVMAADVQVVIARSPRFRTGDPNGDVRLYDPTSMRLPLAAIGLYKYEECTTVQELADADAYLSLIHI